MSSAPNPREASVSTHLTFEHPLNERVRTFLRIEHLFERLNHFAPQYVPWASRAAVETLLDIASVTARSDLRNEVMKELERHQSTLTRMADLPGVDASTLDRVLDDLAHAIDAMNGLSSPIGQTVREDDFLKGVAQRSSIPGGSCSFDLPQFHFWLTRSPEARQARLEHWLRDLWPAAQAINLILGLTRTSASPRQVVAENGFFQEALDMQGHAQMVRVGVDAEGILYPEVSGHKGRFSIRFMTLDQDGRPTPVAADIPFRLTCCLF